RRRLGGALSRFSRLVCRRHRGRNRRGGAVVLTDERNQGVLAGQDDLHATVQRPAFLAVVRRPRHIRTNPLAQQTVLLQTTEAKDGSYRRSPVAAQVAIELVGAAA